MSLCLFCIFWAQRVRTHNTTAATEREGATQVHNKFEMMEDQQPTTREIAPCITILSPIVPEYPKYVTLVLLWLLLVFYCCFFV